MELILTNSNRAAKLIESFKGVAVDRANLEIRTLELVSYIEQVVRSLGPYLKRAKLDVQITGAKAELKTAAGALAQVMTNLLQNVAIHAYQNQGGVAQIKVKKASNELIIIEVQDFGRGIPDEALNRVFEPLYTTRLGEGGSGLGLHLCYEMVEKKLFGSIELDSRAGKAQNLQFDYLKRPRLRFSPQLIQCQSTLIQTVPHRLEIDAKGKRASATGVTTLSL